MRRAILALVILVAVLLVPNSALAQQASPSSTCTIAWYYVVQGGQQNIQQMSDVWLNYIVTQHPCNIPEVGVTFPAPPFSNTTRIAQWTPWGQWPPTENTGWFTLTHYFRLTGSVTLNSYADYISVWLLNYGNTFEGCPGAAGAAYPSIPIGDQCTPHDTVPFIPGA